MFEVYHALKIKKLRSQSKAERLERLTSYAEANPKSYLSQFFAAREAWFQRDLTTAHYYAKRALALDAEPYHVKILSLEALSLQRREEKRLAALAAVNLFGSPRFLMYNNM